MSLEQTLIDSFFTQLAKASTSNEQVSVDYQLGFLNGVLKQLVTVPGVTEILLKATVRLGDIANKRLERELEIVQHQAFIHKSLVESYRKEQKSVEVPTPKPNTKPTFKYANTQYKKRIQKVLLELFGLEQYGFYFNDVISKTSYNMKTARRIKIGISRFLSEFELGTLSAALGKEFDSKIEVKNFTYRNRPSVIVYFRR